MKAASAQIVSSILIQLLQVASPAIQETLASSLAGLEKQAKATANPWDDILVAALKETIGSGVLGSILGRHPGGGEE